MACSNSVPPHPAYDDKRPTVAWDVPLTLTTPSPAPGTRHVAVDAARVALSDFVAFARQCSVDDPDFADLLPNAELRALFHRSPVYVYGANCLGEILIADTDSLMDFKPWQRATVRELLESQSIIFAISAVVLQELDELKNDKDNPDRQRKARQVSEWLTELQANPLVRVQRQRLEEVDPDVIATAWDAFDHILAFAVFVHNEELAEGGHGRPVRMVTNHSSRKLRAMAEDILIVSSSEFPYKSKKEVRSTIIARPRPVYIPAPLNAPSPAAGTRHVAVDAARVALSDFVAFVRERSVDDPDFAELLPNAELRALLRTLLLDIFVDTASDERTTKAQINVSANCLGEILIPDTDSLMDFEPWQRATVRELLESQSIIFAISAVVLQELDELKNDKDNPDRQRKARQVSEWLTELQANQLVRVQRQRLEEVDPEIIATACDASDHILAFVVFVHDEELAKGSHGRPVRMVTDCTYYQLRATAEDILIVSSSEFPQNNKKGTPTNTSNEVGSTFTAVATASPNSVPPHPAYDDKRPTVAWNVPLPLTAPSPAAGTRHVAVDAARVALSDFGDVVKERPVDDLSDRELRSRLRMLLA